MAWLRAQGYPGGEPRTGTAMAVRQYKTETVIRLDTAGGELIRLQCVPDADGHEVRVYCYSAARAEKKPSNGASPSASADSRKPQGRPALSDRTHPRRDRPEGHGAALRTTPRQPQPPHPSRCSLPAQARNYLGHRTLMASLRHAYRPGSSVPQPQIRTRSPAGVSSQRRPIWSSIRQNSSMIKSSAAMAVVLCWASGFTRHSGAHSWPPPDNYHQWLLITAMGRHPEPSL